MGMFERALHVTSTARPLCTAQEARKAAVGRCGAPVVFAPRCMEAILQLLWDVNAVDVIEQDGSLARLDKANRQYGPGPL